MTYPAGSFHDPAGRHHPQLPCPSATYAHAIFGRWPISFAVAQLMVYALAFSRRTGLRLFDFVCAWFDDQHYNEFFPRTWCTSEDDSAETGSERT